MINRLLDAEQTAVSDEQLDLGMTQKILLRQPRRQTNVGRQAVDFTFVLPHNSLRETSEGLDEGPARRFRQVDAPQDGAEAQVNESGVSGSADEILQILNSFKDHQSLFPTGHVTNGQPMATLVRYQRETKSTSMQIKFTSGFSSWSRTACQHLHNEE